MRKRLVACCASLVLWLTASSVAAATITIDFDGFDPTTNFMGGTEDGFNLQANLGGTPGQLAVDGGGTPPFLGPFSGRNALHNQTPAQASLYIISSRGQFGLSSLRAGVGSPGHATLRLFGISYAEGLSPVEDSLSVSGGAYSLLTPNRLAGKSLDLLVIYMDPRSGPLHVDDIVLTQAAVPEPATVVLFGLGATCVAAARRRHPRGRRRALREDA